MLPPQERDAWLQALSDEDFAELEYDWSFWARPNQVAPGGEWSVWLILAGRGFGKTRCGAEWVRSMMCGDTPLAAGRCRHMAIVGETAADVRDVMVGDGKGAGEASGLLQVHPKDYMPVYQSSKRRLVWPNGAIATLYNATEPDQLRGPQHDGAWCDELAKWRYAQSTWDQLQFGLRLGEHPRVMISTTPRPIKLLKEIIADPATVITRGSTYENEDNLAAPFLATVKRKYEGTRLGRQELEAEVLDDVPGALWSRARLDELRVDASMVPALRRVVIAIDPPASSGEDADEAGIIAAGVGANGHGYILEDQSRIATPIEWAKEAVALYGARQGDLIVGEVNNGGEMVENTIRVVSPKVPFKAVHASRGKFIRAEPVSALYEQGRVHHVGAFPQLEDQMCAFTPDFDRNEAGYSPDRLDALVWALTELMLETDMVFAGDMPQMMVEPFPIPEHWPRAFAMDVELAQVSALWAAWDTDSDKVYLYAEYKREAGEPALHAAAIRGRHPWIPGLIVPNAHGRKAEDAERLVDQYLDLQVDLFTIDDAAETAITDIWQRLSTGGIKVFSTCTEWVREFRNFARDDKGAVPKAGMNLMACTRHLVMQGRMIAAPEINVTATEDEDRFAENTANTTTGY